MILRLPSLPARERGSKPWRGGLHQRDGASLPARERGSKLAEHARRASRPVAPRAGARIETMPVDGCRATRSSRSPRGSADRNYQYVYATNWPRRRSPRGSADRNDAADLRVSLPARERGSKPRHHARRSRRCRRRSPRGSADRNMPDGKGADRRRTSLPSRERGSKPLQRRIPLDREMSLPHGSADRSHTTAGDPGGGTCRSLMGARIETLREPSSPLSDRSLPHGSADPDRHSASAVPHAFCLLVPAKVGKMQR